MFSLLSPGLRKFPRIPHGDTAPPAAKSVPGLLDEYPFYSPVVRLVHIAFHPVFAQNMTGHFYHNVVGFHACITLVTRQPLQTRGTRGKHLHFSAEAVRPDLL